MSHTRRRWSQRMARADRLRVRLARGSGARLRAANGAGVRRSTGRRRYRAARPCVLSPPLRRRARALLRPSRVASRKARSSPAASFSRSVRRSRASRFSARVTGRPKSRGRDWHSPSSFSASKTMRGCAARSTGVRSRRRLGRSSGTSTVSSTPTIAPSFVVFRCLGEAYGPVEAVAIGQRDRVQPEHEAAFHELLGVRARLRET